MKALTVSMCVVNVTLSITLTMVLATPIAIGFGALYAAAWVKIATLM